MKILCSYSSLEFNCDYFPGTYTSRELHHPIFNLPQKSLLSATKKWSAGELTTTDSYLLFLALLNSTGIVEFRVPVIRVPETDALIAQHMESLLRTVIKLNTVAEPELVFPSFVITNYSRDLLTIPDLIHNWNSAYRDFKDGYVSAHESQKLIQRDSALSRMIKNPYKKPSDYAITLADWASLAGQFPSFTLQSPIDNKQTTCSDYWKAIIRYCTKNEYLFKVPTNDLHELIEHCEEHIDIGSINSHLLFKVLRTAAEKKRNYLGLGDLDLGKTKFVVLDSPASSSEEHDAALLQASILSAPSEKPRPEQYKGKMEFIRANLRWQALQESLKNQPKEGESK